MPGLIDTTTGLAEGTTGLIWLSGGLGGDGLDANLFSPQASQFFARLATQPTSARKTLYAACIDALVAADVWTRLDVLYVLAAADASTAKANLVSSSYTLTPVNSPTFTVDKGYTGNGSTQELTTGLADNAAAQYAQNSAHISIWDLTVRAGAAQTPVGASSDAHIYTRFGDDNTYCRIQGGGGNATVSANEGFTLGNRSGANADQVYKNGSQIASLSDGSVPLTADTFSILRAPGVAYSSDQIAAVSIGSSLSSGRVTALYNALHTYLTAVGAT